MRLRRGSAHLPLSVRKTAALLLLAAIAGPLPRVRLVEWLWPALDESTGRRNLRRELARLRELGAGDALVSADDCVAIAPTLALDIDAAAVTPQALLTHWRGPLADGLQLDDAPAFMDWLAGERARWHGRWRDALAAEASQAESAGELARALAALDVLLADDPLQEHQQRAAMRLLAALGRREEALVRYRDCRSRLHDELGLMPMAETDALAAEVARGGVAEPRASGAVSAPPPQAARPVLPVLLPFVGREAEVAVLERAWRDGATVLVEGEGGVGKTRLVVDVVASHGPHAVVRCHPADAGLP
ncbi:MAG: hypothetical protein KDG57_09825, partial [Rhodoferax sp.]|nr:hypothetical protein [Rhodoferax sp.]